MKNKYVAVMMAVSLGIMIIAMNGCGGGKVGGSHVTPTTPVVTRVIGLVILEAANANLARSANQGATPYCGSVPAGFVAVTGADVVATGEDITAQTDSDGCFEMTISTPELKIFTATKNNSQGGVTVLKKAAFVEHGKTLEFVSKDAFKILTTIAALIVEDKLKKGLDVSQDDLEGIEGFLAANEDDPSVAVFKNALLSSADPGSSGIIDIASIDIRPLSESEALSGGKPTVYNAVVSGGPVDYYGGTVTITADATVIGGDATVQSVVADMTASGVSTINVTMTLVEGNTYSGTYTFSQNTSDAAVRYTILITATDSSSQTDTYGDTELIAIHGGPSGETTVSSICGDGILEVDEACDSGSSNADSACIPSYGGSCSYCDTSCTVQTVSSSEFCGDTLTNGQEECDNGSSNTNTECTPGYGISCTYCTTSCTSHTVQGGTCGDGTLNSGETCDGGTVNTDTACVPGYGSSCSYCDTSCALQSVNAAEYCGDGNISDAEECDDGNFNTDTSCSPPYGSSCSYCDTTCKSHSIFSIEYCGDDSLQTPAGEQCDYGTSNTDTACTPGYGETCAYCNLSCQSYNLAGASCGDGSMDSSSGEECDAGSTNTNTACTPGYDTTCSYCDTSCNSIVVQGQSCGDGSLQAAQGEECDSGSGNTNTACTAGYDASCSYCDTSCKSHTVPAASTCGDGTLDSIYGEACDDGALNTDIACTPPSAANRGANILTIPDSCTYCDTSCQPHTIKDTADCGDGTLQAANGEQCDDGASNGTACTAGYDSECSYCSNSCQTITLPSTGNCGDGTVNGAEQCDAGASNTFTPCDPGYGGSCTYCDLSCVDHTVQGIYCGDGNTDTSYDEECDHGASNTDWLGCGTTYGSSCEVCTSGCISYIFMGGYCGDGNINGSETCDDGNINNGDGCDSTCAIEPFCGNGSVEPGEDCDAGAETSTCDADCTSVSCGDGNFNPTAGEGCDDGNTTSGDDCSSSCQLETVCGNGTQELGEDCDSGASNTDTACTPAYGSSCTYCNTSCQSNSALGASCGDGTMNGTETCDEGTSNTNTACTPAYGSSCNYCDTSCVSQTVQGVSCGDGTINGSETCDEGASNTDTACTPAYGSSCTYCNTSCGSQTVTSSEYCGDGAINGSETCDDGASNTDTACTPAYGSSCSYCNTSCGSQTVTSSEYCGDGTVNGTEVCDEGSSNSDTACTPAYGASCTYCNIACTSSTTIQGGSCGDSITNGTETCDDGNTDETDGCSSSCSACLVDMTSECTSNSDCCSGSCIYGESASLCVPQVYCGDSDIDTGEECDNGAFEYTSDTSDYNGKICTPGSYYGSTCTYCSDACSNVVYSTDGYCGDGIVDAQREQCDDGNTTSADGCNSECFTEYYYNCHYYTLHQDNREDGDSDSYWSAGNSYCATRGGYLMKIDDENENNFLRDNFDETAVWIGLRDVDTEGTFVWSNGAPAVYFNWGGSNPDNWTGLNPDGEDCVSVLDDGTWNDSTCSEGFPFTCEYEISCGNGIVETGETCDDGNAIGGDGCTMCGATENDYFGQTYAIGRCENNWNEAKLVCESENGYLATVNNSAENDYIISLHDGGTSDYFIGYNDISAEGAFVWDNGSSSSFTDWGTGNPDNNTGSYSNVENCVEYSYTWTSGKWNDTECLTTKSYICEYGAERCGNGVVESGEWCDDGNSDDSDECGNDCLANPLCDSSITDMNQIVSGEMWTIMCYINSSNNLKCWGSNTVGQNGDGTMISSNEAVNVIGLTSGNAAEVSIKYTHACAVTTSGAVKCWGSNTYGQLGNDSTTMSKTPVDVTGLDSGVVNVAVGDFSTCALTNGGGVKCWGDGSYGERGDGTTTMIYKVPVDVYGLGSGVEKISGGRGHFCALTAGGGVKCWGRNDNGVLGNGSTNISSVPVDVLGLTSGVTDIDAGSTHVCAVLSVGSVKCWGKNNYGQLGNNSNADSTTPVDVFNLSSGVVSVTVGFEHSCALMSNNKVKCWGANYGGQLGDGLETSSDIPVDASVITEGVTYLNAGSSDTCGITVSGKAVCFGRNYYGFGTPGTTGTYLTPVCVE